MSFAPVLDVMTTDPRAEPRRRATRAAGFALRRLAVTDDCLLGTLRLVERPEAKAEQLQVSAAPVLLDVSEKTGVSTEEIGNALFGQLRQVIAFANLDGGTLDANVGAVGALIRSGRVELFAG